MTLARYLLVGAAFGFAFSFVVLGTIAAAYYLGPLSFIVIVCVLLGAWGGLCAWGMR